MPNWCYQTVTIYGDKKEELEFFLETMKDGDEYSLNKFHPTPQELVDTIDGWSNNQEQQAANEKWYARNIAKYGYKSWYDWNCANWGSKWGACRIQISSGSVEQIDGTGIPVIERMNDGTYHLTMKLESAWSPCDKLLLFISGLFPSFMISNIFTEESDAYAGVEMYAAGQIIGSESVTPDMSEAAKYYDDEDSDKYYEALNEAQEALLMELDEIESQMYLFAKVVAK